MIVHAVILNPQGSMGGFDWFYERAQADAHALRVGLDLVLGTIDLSMPDHFTREQITDEIDSYLMEIEDRLGYNPEVYA